MAMASARVMLDAARLPQRGSRYRPTVFLISSAVRCLAAAGRERKVSASAAKVVALRCRSRALVSVRKHFESFESFVIQSGDLIREGHHRCGRRRTADVTTAA